MAAAAGQRSPRPPASSSPSSTDDLPEGINGIQKAEGVATDAPGLRGHPHRHAQRPGVRGAGRSPSTTLVCAQIPLTPGWSDVDPAEYGAPDPAGFLSPDDGFAAILEAATGLEKGESIRGGADNDEILTTYTGTVPGDVVDRVIPGASGDFDLTAQITDDDELREMSLTGVFYDGADANTYTVGFDDYGTTKDIQAP